MAPMEMEGAVGLRAAEAVRATGAMRAMKDMVGYCISCMLRCMYRVVVVVVVMVVVVTIEDGS